MMKSLKLLIIVSILLIIAVLLPPLPFPSKQYDYFFIVDITRSMNVQDYQDEEGALISRLERVKLDMLSVIRQLSCGSRVGLGVFTERMPTMLHSPIEVCSDYPELRKSISHLDWRMAWVADSNIIRALYNSLKLMRTVNLNKSTLVFFTDGHESPPMNMQYAPSFSDVQTDDGLIPIKGIIVGTGQHRLSRIPKYDEEGNQTGYYTAEDVPHNSNFGLPADPSQIKGYVPRNAPWGNQNRSGNEHLSNVREKYLHAMANKAGLRYHHLQTSQGLFEALTHESFSNSHIQLTDLSFIPAGIALLLLTMIYFPKTYYRYS
jgi:mxaL protein